MRRNWTAEEKDYLDLSWGSVSLPHIAKKLDRSPVAVKLKAYRMGLGDPVLSADGISLNQLSFTLDISYNILLRWIDEYKLPARRRRLSIKQRILMVNYDQFWAWADNHRHLLDFSRIEKFALGKEPDWVAVMRDLDASSVSAGKKGPWTEEDDRLLKSMVNAHCYTYPEISKRLRRTEAAVKRRLYDLKIKARPIRQNNHIKYTQKETQDLLRFYKEGMPIDKIAERLGKSSLGIRGKLERMDYTFKDKQLVKREEAK